MAKAYFRSAFTLIEVMVAVMIISVVILALLNMQGNSSFIFSKLTKDAQVNQYASFFISNTDYGFENKNVRMDALVKEFDVENKLRRELKNVKVEVIYQELEKIDMQEYEDTENTLDEYDEQGVLKQNSSSMAFEVGKTILKVKGRDAKEEASTSLIRLRMQ